MDLQNTQTQGIELIKNFGEILILIRYPYQAGNKDFFLINSEQEFVTFLNERKSKESITLFKSIETVTEGWVNEDFISKTSSELKKPTYTDWLLLFPEMKDKNDKWHYAEAKNELEESLRINIGKSVRILEDPVWQNEDLIFHAYVPDEDGKIRPGAY